MLTLALASAPDLLFPGHKRVLHQLLLQSGPATSGWTFVAAPTAGFGVEVVTVGEPFAFSSKYGTRLHAFRPGATIPASWNDFVNTGAALPAEIHSVPVMHPLARVLTTLRVLAVDDRGIAVEVVDEQRFDASGAPLYTGIGAAALQLGIAAIGLAGLVLITRRRAPVAPRHR